MLTSFIVSEILLTPRFVFHCISFESGKSAYSFPPYFMDVGGLLLKHILQLICNAHAITSLERTTSAKECDDLPDTNVDAQEQVRIATAIYPTASLMNHSCDPTIVSR